MYLLIAIVFIAELLIVGHLIGIFLKADRWACRTNKKISENSKKIIDIIVQVRMSSNMVKCYADMAVKFVKKQRRVMIWRLFRIFLLYLLIYIIKVKYKSGSKILKYAVLVKDVWENVLV